MTTTVVNHHQPPDQAPPQPRRDPARTPTRRPAGSGAEVLSVLSTSCALLAVVSLWLLVQLPFLSVLSEGRAQSLMYPEFRSALAAATAPTGGVIPSGTPVALLSVPTLGLRQIVVEGTTGSDLRSGPGHRRDTPLPGQAGISVVYGRAATYGAPFAGVDRLNVGDEVVVEMGQGRVVYTVRDVRRAGDPIPPAPTGHQGRLTLASAEGSGPLAAISPSTAVYVDATVEKAFDASTGRPAITANEQVLASDRSALPMLTLCLALLIAAACGVVWALQRWRAALVWVVTAPVVLALSWFSGDVVVRLLPNLM